MYFPVAVPQELSKVFSLARSHRFFAEICSRRYGTHFTFPSRVRFRVSVAPHLPNTQSAASGPDAHFSLGLMNIMRRLSSKVFSRRAKRMILCACFLHLFLATRYYTGWCKRCCKSIASVADPLPVLLVSAAFRVVPICGPSHRHVYNERGYDDVCVGSMS